ITYLRIAHAGRSAARNAGLAAARGDYVNFHDSDDFLLPDKVARQVALLQTRSDLDVAYCEYRFVDAAGRELPMTGPYERLVLAEGRILAPLLDFDFIPLPTLLIRRSLLSGGAAFDPRFEPCEDYDLVLRLARRHPVGLSR